MNDPISTAEISDAMNQMSRGKSPGRDDLPVEFYLIFKHELISYYKTLLNEILSIGSIPESWKESLISLIHKTNSDPKEIKNYRLIALLNADYKLFVYILANRLKIVLNELIHKDQAGFLPQRYLRNYLRIIYDMLEYFSHPGKQLAIIFLDSEKAFDNVNWNFLLSVFRKNKWRK